MKARIDYTNVPEVLRGMYQLEHYIHNSGLEESLIHLVKMRFADQWARVLPRHAFERRPRPRRFPAFWPRRRNNHGSILRGNLGYAVAVCSRGHSALVRDPVGIEQPSMRCCNRR